MSRQHEWTAKDSDGNHQDYVALPHPAGEGLKLLAELMAIGSRGLRGALGSMKFDALSKAAGDGDVSGLDGLDIDEAMLGAAVGEVMQALGERDVLELCRRLLAYTTRGGLAMRGGRMPSGAESFSFDVAYSANYGELRTALTEVARYNFGSFFGGLGGRGVLRKLAEVAPK
jgi:hypothetical protein